ncbi:MAG: DUF1330 domain-containing protein [Pseudomonadota bacterium]
MIIRLFRRNRSVISACGMLLVLGLAVSTPRPAAAQNGPVQFMDLNWLKSGADAGQAGIYFNDLLAPILKKHGAKVVFSYAVTGVMAGDIKPAVTASMEFPSMHAMQAMFNDPDYKKIVPYRDATFDLSRQILFQIAPLKGR